MTGPGALRGLHGVPGGENRTFASVKAQLSRRLWALRFKGLGKRPGRSGWQRASELSVISFWGAGKDGLGTEDFTAEVRKECVGEFWMECLWAMAEVRACVSAKICDVPLFGCESRLLQTC
jgi:hypothetical protein